mgnify:CR=1 FL=1
MTEEEKWLVNDKYCKGCKYYGTLSFSTKTRCCDYTYYTGRIRENMPKHCEVKEKGRKPKGNTSTSWLSEKGMREGRKRG